MSRIKNFDYMEDCIHLKACRRLQKLFRGKFYGANVSRNCDEDCTAYVSGNQETSYITIDEALSYARNGISSIQSGYDSYDVYASCDLYGKPLNEIIADCATEDEQ